jgi:hypothetical protein
MSALIISSITDYSKDYASGETFDRLLDELKERMIGKTPPRKTSNELEKIYVQYEFGLAGMPSAAKGIRFDRYSKANRHTGANIEIPRQVFQTLDEHGKTELLRTTLKQTLRELERRLNGKVSNDIAIWLEILDGLA